MDAEQQRRSHLHPLNRWDWDLTTVNSQLTASGLLCEFHFCSYSAGIITFSRLFFSHPMQNVMFEDSASALADFNMSAGISPENSIRGYQVSNAGGHHMQ